VQNTSTVQVFDFENSKVRVVMIKGNPWFVAKDVFPALGFSLAGGTTPYLKNLDNGERKVVTRADSQDLFMGVRTPSYTIVSESAPYKLDDGEKTIVPPNLHRGKGMNKATLIKRDSRILNTRDMDFIHVCSMSSALLGFSASP